MERATRGGLSNNNRDFIHKAIREEVRIDARSLYDHRKLGFQVGLLLSGAVPPAACCCRRCYCLLPPL